eukprot:scpid110106/ scgid24064/ 
MRNLSRIDIQCTECSVMITAIFEFIHSFIVAQWAISCPSPPFLSQPPTWTCILFHFIGDSTYLSSFIGGVTRLFCSIWNALFRGDNSCIGCVFLLFFAVLFSSASVLLVQH